MAQSPISIKTETDLTLNENGKLYIYISDRDVGNTPQSDAAHQWAHEVTSGVTADRTVSLELTIDLVHEIRENLDTHDNTELTEEKLISIEYKPKFDALRDELEKALALLNSAQYVFEPKASWLD